jgi:hypothetical protein
MTTISFTRIAMQLAARSVCAVPGKRPPGAKPEAFSEQVAACGKKLRRFVDEADARKAPPAFAAWILDHYPDFYSALRDVANAVPPKYCRLLPRLADGAPRIAYLTSRLVELADAELSGDGLAEFLEAFQHSQRLTLGELWAAYHFTRFALIERIARETEIDQPSEEAVRRAVRSLRSLERGSWKEAVERISRVEAILREDPSGDYPRMAFETRDHYRHSIEITGRKSARKGEDAATAEERVARTAVEMGGHVGYWLIDRGRDEWRARCGYRHSLVRIRRFVQRHAVPCFLMGVALSTAGIMAGAWAVLAPIPLWCLLLLLLPAMHVALAILNPLVTFSFSPKRLPRYDFSEVVPDEYKTFVVVPTLLLSRENTESLLENLEIHYLANRDPRILFALLTDFADSQTETGPNDYLAELCAEGIEKLNRRHGTVGYSPFYLFHRPRQWNPGEGQWMGHERKRGKLNDFNRYLLGRGDAFSLKAGDLAAARDVRFVITLDSDTQLPRDTARNLIATLAHPLNRAVLDPVRKIVRSGYGLLQPRVSVSVQSSVRSRLARIYSGQVGFDPYTTAVSDVYQDLCGAGSFTGKGIYDVAVFEAAAGERFPDNTLLSHDLIEGEHVRVGLASDLEVIDDFPARYDAFSKRKHRWVRGDWQILRWLFSGNGNTLGALSRWKIFDNLRRSLMEISLLLLFIAAWTFLPGSPLRWTMVALALFVLPVWFDLIVAAIRIPPPRFVPAYVREVSYRFARGHIDAFLTLIFLAHQALLMGDAIVRTLVRQFVTHRHLLEWESMAQTESAKSSHRSLSNIYLYCSPAIALILMLTIPAHERWSDLAFALLELWLFAPVVAMWLDAKPPRARELKSNDVAFLREIALQTWRYFADSAGPDNHWLAPDNIQETPPMEAHRTSPTNIGLQLNAYVAALDFGYLTAEEFAEYTRRTLATLDRLPKSGGHFLNWYDTNELTGLEPRYISSVDSGNLLASLIVLKQACLEASGHPVFSVANLDGLRDHARNVPAVRRLLNAVSAEGPDSLFHDIFHIGGLVTEALELARRASPKPELLIERLEAERRQLCHLAPWLCEPREREFRFCFNRPAFETLIKLLRAAVKWNELPAQYEAIEAEASKILDAGLPIHDLTRTALEDLLNELAHARGHVQALLESWRKSAETADAMVRETSFTELFDAKANLLLVGRFIEGSPAQDDESYYDLLASEARTAILLGIAKGELPRNAWFQPGRKLTQWRGNRCLLSWSGTMFEYLMPNLFMRTWEGTLLHESCCAAVRIQRAHAAHRRIPWGISESAYNSRDSLLNYQYHAFGVPALATRRDFPEHTVVAPYATMLALTVDAEAALQNARLLAARGWMGKYGFFEAIDFTPVHRFSRRREGTVVRSWMAHHQGMTLLAIDSAVNNNPMQKRFHADPLVQSAEYLLQERAPNLLMDEIDRATLAPPPRAAENSISDELQNA